jgi:site-specific recombinase XerC
MSQRPPKPKVPRGVEARWHAGRAAWTFRVRWTDPVSGERRSQEFDTADDALDYQAYLRLARRRGALDELSRGRVVLSEFVEDDWWPNHAGRQLSRHTLTAYSQVWNRNLLPRVGHLELRQLTTPTVQTLREALEGDGVRPATVRKSLAVLQSICAHAVRKGELTINPVSAVRKPPAKRAVVIDPFSVEEVEALIGALRDRANHPSQWMLAELIAYSGARPQDALALSYGRIGTRRIVYGEKNIDGRIVSGSKTGEDRARSVTLFASLRKDLLAFRLAAGNPPDDALVLPQAEGKPWRLHDYKNWQRNAVKTERSSRAASIFAAAATAIGRPDATPYFLATPTPASGSPSSGCLSKRSPRRWGTPSRSSRARTRTSSRSTAAAGPSPPTRSSRAPAGEKRPKNAPSSATDSWNFRSRRGDSNPRPHHYE